MARDGEDSGVLPPQEWGEGKRRGGMENGYEGDLGTKEKRGKGRVERCKGREGVGVIIIVLPCRPF